MLSRISFACMIKDIWMEIAFHMPQNNEISPRLLLVIFLIVCQYLQFHFHFIETSYVLGDFFERSSSMLKLI